MKGGGWGGGGERGRGGDRGRVKVGEEVVWYPDPNAHNNDHRLKYDIAKRGS